MKQLYIIICLSLSTHLFSQTTTTVDSFYPTKTKKPDNYQALIFDANGWTFVAEYFFDNKSISTKPQGGSSKTNRIFYAKENTPYKGVYTKAKGNKLIFYGDRRATAKLIYIDEHTLIIEEKTFRPGKIKKSGVVEKQTYTTTMARTIYKR